MADTSPPPFYVYTEPALDHSWLASCEGFERLESQQSLHARFSMPEVVLHRLMLAHPARVTDPDKAKLFYVPIYEFTSTLLGADIAFQHVPGRAPVLLNAGAARFNRTVGAYPADGLMRCNGTTHRERMEAAALALKRSPHWQRHLGHDHMWASAAFSIGKQRLKDRLGVELSRRLKNAAAGRYKGGYPPNNPSGVSACTFEMPVMAGKQATRAYDKLSGAARGHDTTRARGAAQSDRSGVHAGTARAPKSDSAPFSGPGSVSGLTRPTLVHFRGTLDVCCSGYHTRCAVGHLVAEAWHDADVVVRPAVPKSGLNNSGWGRGKCTGAAVAALAQRLNTSMSRAFELYVERSGAPVIPPRHGGRGRDGGGGGGGRSGAMRSGGTRSGGGVRSGGSGGGSGGSGGDGGGDGSSGSHGAEIDKAMLRTNEAEMLQSVFCLVPAGDSIITDRLYTAIAAGCLPVVLSPVRPGAFKELVNYSSFVLPPVGSPIASITRLKTQPGRFLKWLRAIPAAEIAARQRAMHQHRADLLFDAEGSRVVGHFLRSVVAQPCWRRGHGPNPI